MSRLKFGAVAAFALLAGAAAAQSPSSDDIIKSLRPGAGFSGGTRGIRPTMQAPEPAPTPSGSPSYAPAPARRAEAPRAAPPQAQAEAPSVNLNVPFATGSADLTPAAARSLAALGRALASPALAGSRFRIEGHTDTVGSPDANKALSARRAATVVDYLAEHFSLDRSRLDPVGMGEEGLLVPTPPERAEPRNRRVQVVNIGA